MTTDRTDTTDDDGGVGRMLRERLTRHPAPVLLRASREPQILELDSEPLGVFSSTVLHHRDIHMQRGDRFFLYTDGLIESKAGKGRTAGLEALVQASRLHSAAPLAQAPARIAAVLWPEPESVEDDLLLLAVDL